MWDEITVNIPPGVDSYRTIEAIHNTVLKETEKDAALAEQEWQMATVHNGLSQFKATPSVDMRPAASGVDIVVRYVIRAGDRFETRNRLYQAVILTSFTNPKAHSHILRNTAGWRVQSLTRYPAVARRPVRFSLQRIGPRRRLEAVPTT